MALPETAELGSPALDTSSESLNSESDSGTSSDKGAEKIQHTTSQAGSGALGQRSLKSLGTGGWFVSVLIGIVVHASILSSTSAQPTRLMSLLSAGVAGVSLVTVALSLIGLSKSAIKPYDLLPLGGVGCFIAAVVVALIGDETDLVSALVASSPAFAAGAMWLGRLAILSRAEARDVKFFSQRKRSGRISPTLKSGDRFSVKAGLELAVDSRIESGSVGIDETLFSTVPTFKIKDEEDVIPAGSTVLTGLGEVIALSDADGSSAGQLERAFGSQIRESAQGLLTEDSSASRWTTLVLFFGAVFAAIFWSERSVSLIEPLMACGFVLLQGCVLQISQYLYLRRRVLVDEALRQGLVLRGPQVCRQLSLVDAVEVDASRIAAGLLPRVVDFKIVDDRLEREAFCNFIVSLLGRAEDPYLVAFGEYLRHQIGTISTERVLDLREYPEKGICGTIHGVELSVGTEAFLVERGIMVQPSDLESEYEEASSTIYVAIDDDIVAHADFRSDQEDVVPLEEPCTTRDGVVVRVSPGISRDLPWSTLLVRGKESDVVSVNAPLQEGAFSPERGSLPETQLVSLSAAVAPILSVIHACKVEARAIERYRMVVGISGIISVVAAFLGVYWSALALISIGVAQAVVRLSQPKNSDSVWN